MKRSNLVLSALHVSTSLSELDGRTSYTVNARPSLRPRTHSTANPNRPSQDRWNIYGNINPYTGKKK
jgi:hypothetical protein